MKVPLYVEFKHFYVPADLDLHLTQVIRYYLACYYTTFLFITDLLCSILRLD